MHYTSKKVLLSHVITRFFFEWVYEDNRFFFFLMTLYKFGNLEGGEEVCIVLSLHILASSPPFIYTCLQRRPLYRLWILESGLPTTCNTLGKIYHVLLNLDATSLGTKTIAIFAKYNMHGVHSPSSFGTRTT